MIQNNHQQLVHTFAALADLGQEIANKRQFGDMVRTSLHLLLGSLAIMRGGVARFNRASGDLSFMAVRGLSDDFPLYFPFDKSDEAEFLRIGLCAVEVERRTAGLSTFVAMNLKQFTAGGIKLIVPLIVQEELVGVVLLGGKATGDPFTDVDKQIICALARHIGVGIQGRNTLAELERQRDDNRRLYEDLRTTYKNTVQSFAAAIDCKDKYTEGHSERVGKYSEIIAEAIGWDTDRSEGAAVAGYLHDVGKLVVDRELLNSPIRLNAAENSQLVRHTTAGFEILLPISHPFTDVPLAARHHHERIDGNGYPDKLKGDEIPYIAKIVTLADSFDAMTTDRPYKRRRTAEEVVADLERNSGKQFAPELVVSFGNAWLKELTGDTKKKRITKLLGKGYVAANEVVPKLKQMLNSISPTSGLTTVTS